MFVFTADIIKMFRKIRVDSADQDFQRILWSPDSDTPPNEYRLKTVMYGTLCAHFLAMRTLQQLALEGKSRFPLGATCITANIFVDDNFRGRRLAIYGYPETTGVVGLIKIGWNSVGQVGF
jgi:hypothetical protein